jgi:hypothetical protein
MFDQGLSDYVAYSAGRARCFTDRPTVGDAGTAHSGKVPLVTALKVNCHSPFGAVEVLNQRDAVAAVVQTTAQQLSARGQLTPLRVSFWWTLGPTVEAFVGLGLLITAHSLPV